MHFTRIVRSISSQSLTGNLVLYQSRKMCSEAFNRVLIVGLGNHDLPATRHSIGMRLVEELRALLDIRWARDRGIKAFWAKAEIPVVPESDILQERVSLEIVLLMPTLPMNVNGKSVSAAVQHFNVHPRNVYLVHDDLNRTAGKFSMKEGGSAGGHNGIKSVCNSLHTQDLTRLRIGIDRPPDRGQVVDYVLSPLPPHELTVFNDTKISMLALLLRHIETSFTLPKHHLVQVILPGV